MMTLERVVPPLPATVLGRQAGKGPNHLANTGAKSFGERALSCSTRPIERGNRETRIRRAALRSNWGAAP